MKSGEDSAAICVAEDALSQITLFTEQDDDDDDDDREEKEVVVKDTHIRELSARTGMSYQFSHQCLEECGWDMIVAMEAFCRVRDAGMLP